jgi:hypothetical protein|tara:strand:+ start:264 stop:395 length:132 start_codon:yes stop_codon:yes gene_type:complete
MKTKTMARTKQPLAFYRSSIKWKALVWAAVVNDMRLPLVVKNQ